MNIDYKALREAIVSVNSYYADKLNSKTNNSEYLSIIHMLSAKDYTTVLQRYSILASNIK